MGPDPPDESTEVEDMMPSNSNTAKDSQESITLLNALQPLPDTQNSTQPASPQIHRSLENHATPCVQLFSRPKENTATDLDIEFAWGQPMKVDPGRFSNRPKPAKAVLQTVDSNRDETPSTIFMDPRPDLGEQIVFEDDRASRTAKLDTPTSMPVPQKILPKSLHRSHLLDPTSHSFIQDHASARAYQHQAVVGKIPAPSDAAAARVARKKPPFDDLQPVRQVSHHKEPLPTPTTASTTPPEVRLVELCCEEPCADTTPGRSGPNTLQQPLKQSQMQVPPQKSRTSLRNDISVSSDGAPRQLPQHSSTGPGSASRPMREDQGRSSRVNTPRTRSQTTPATKSNTKRKRPAQDSVLSSESHFSNEYSSAQQKQQQQQQQTPSLRPRQRSPQGQLREMFVQKLAVHKGEVAGYLNDKWSDMEQQMDQQIHGIIADLKQKLKQQEFETSRYKKSTRFKDSKIKKLEEDHEQLVETLESSKRELQERTAKFSKLDEKCRKYKEYLNSAIAEQQELYKTTKAKCDGAITQMKDEESNRQVLQERERKNAEATRERLSQLVRTTVAEQKQKENELNDKIKFLSQKIEERDADLLRERNTAQILQEQNVSITSIQDTLKSFETKIDEVMSKTIEAASCQKKKDDPEPEEMRMKLDQITDHLRTLDERTYSKDNVFKELQELNEKAVVSILEKLKPILDSQLETKTDLDHLSAGFEEYVDQLWAALENRQVVLEESIEQRQAESEQKIIILQSELEMTQQECVKQKQLVDTLEAAISERESEIEGLIDEVAELENSQVDSLAQSELLRRVQDEHAKLSEEATAKAVSISELEAKLEETKLALAAEGKKHQTDTNEFRKLLEQRLAEAQTSQAHAVEAAQRSDMLRMNEMKADIEKRLAQALEERAALQNDLEVAKQQIATLGDDGSRSSEKIHHLEQELEKSRFEAVKSKEEMSQKETEQQNVREQQSKLVGDLQSQLASAEQKYNKLVENAKSYDKAAHTVWQSLTQWTSDYAAIQEVHAKLDQTKDADPDHINPKFKPLVQIQLLHKAIARYCRTQKAAAEMLSAETLGGSADCNTEIQSTSQSCPPTSEALITASQSSTGGMMAHLLRRVVVKSPASNAPSPTPPSVRFEQNRRRKADPPKPILKLAPDTQVYEAEDQAPPQEPPGRWLYRHGRPVDPASSNLNRGSYNRIVAGSQPPLVLPAIKNGLCRNTLSNDGVTEQESMTERRKRKELPDQEAEASRKRARPTTKRQRETIANPQSSPPEPDGKSASDVEHVPRAPRKAGFRLVTDETPTSPIRSSQLSRNTHQYRTATGTRAGRLSSDARMPSSKRMSSLDSNKDPLSLFFQFRHSTRGNEDSQDSLTLSQDVDVEARSQASLNSFKRHITMGP